MPAYITVTDRLRASCGKRNCDPSENPEHYVRVEIGPAIIDPIEELIERANQANGHLSPSDTDCIMLARAIKKARRMLRGIKGKSL